MISAAVILTFKRGGGMVGLIASAISILSGAYFPLSLLPEWFQERAEANPVGIAFESTRQALLGGATLADVGGDVLVIGAWAILSLALGQISGNLALARERRRGTLSTY
jgi:ABC-2 type transport system permease protein